MKSVMQHNFAQVPKAEIQRSSFDLSHGHKTTFDAGGLYPIYVDEALPGDTFSVRMTGFARLATPIFPIMDNMFMETQFFAIPYRLLWDNFVRMMGEQPNPDDSTDFTIPQLVAPAGGFTAGSMADYFGIPTGVAGLSVNALFFRAYNLCYNEWYRDQNLQDRVPFNKGDGPDVVGDYVIRARGKRPDYFTSCLPFPQKGPGVLLPLGSTAPVIGVAGLDNGVNVATTWRSSTGTLPPGQNDAGFDTAGNLRFGTVAFTPNAEGGYHPANLVADLSAASSATINSLRQAFQVQRLFERDARGGTRYTESVKAHFGVTSPDSRLQRPEYLGGGHTSVNISPIPQTSASGAYAATPQGTLAAMGTASMHGHGFTHSFTEHCLILGLISVRADLTYQKGLNRMWSRKTRLDHFYPALAHLGEQAVLQKEIYADGIPANDDKVFGYQERFAEYRFRPSLITGLFRSNAAQSLDAWHLSQDFANAPVLDAAFIEDNPPLERVIAVTTEPHFILDTYFSIRAARPMPTFGVPGYIDHF